MHSEVSPMKPTSLKLPSNTQEPFNQLATSLIMSSPQPSNHKFSDEKITQVQVILIVHEKE